MGSPSLACCLLGLLTLTWACYIQNCPKGRKRAARDAEVRQCPSCGPENRARCFGPYFCCGKDLGCFLDEPQVLPCQEEEGRPTPCDPGTTPCGDGGHCATRGICCNNMDCRPNTTCSTDSSFSER